MTKSKKIFFKIPAAVFYSSSVAGEALLRFYFQWKWKRSQSFHRHTSGWLSRPIIFMLLLLTGFNTTSAQVTIKFNLTANGKSLVLNDSTYTNAFNETYQVTRLKYYISNIALHAYDGVYFYDKPTLFEAGSSDSIVLPLGPASYDFIEFTLGVDSVLNCSGAQDDELDPLNGMFWTWNSGYIFFKMEGYSPASTADLQRIEHHVGGYRYPNNAARKITLPFPTALAVAKNDKHTISINVNLDKYWKGKNDIKIAAQALLMTPGGLALKAADNFPGMFSIISIR